ncbi:MAG: winged helix-turn-helix transcriptional regulator [Flavobacteriaceae bacterium]
MKLNNTHCACDVWLRLLGDRWSLIIIRDIFKGKTTYSEFLESQEGIATNILNSRLKSLQIKGIIEFRLDPENQRIKRYYLTEKGIDLYPTIYEIQKWTLKHQDFELTDYGKGWKEFADSHLEHEVITHFQKEYKQTRLKVFGF